MIVVEETYKCLSTDLVVLIPIAIVLAMLAGLCVGYVFGKWGE